MTTADLITWLKAQLDKDYAVAENLLGATRITGREPDFYGCGGPAAQAYWAHFTAHRMLEDVKAKRRIIDAYPIDPDNWDARVAFGGWVSCSDSCPVDVLEHTIRLLALPYAGRDGYREEWRP